MVWLASGVAEVTTFRKQNGRNRPFWYVLRLHRLYPHLAAAYGGQTKLQNTSPSQAAKEMICHGEVVSMASPAARLLC